MKFSLYFFYCVNFFVLFLHVHEIQYNQNMNTHTCSYTNIRVRICKCLFNEMKWIKNVKNPQCHPIFIPVSLFLLGPYKVDFFVCFRLSTKTLFLCHYFLNLSHLFQLFLILLISFKNLWRRTSPYFLALYTCKLSKSKMRFSWYFLIS